MIIPLRYNLRSLFVRRATTAATAIGIALVVFVLSSALMLSEGVRRTLCAACAWAPLALSPRRSADEASAG